MKISLHRRLLLPAILLLGQLLCFQAAGQPPADTEDSQKNPLVGTWFEVAVEHPFADSFLTQELNLGSDATMIRFSDRLEVASSLKSVKFISKAAGGTSEAKKADAVSEPKLNRLIIFLRAEGDGARTSDMFARVWVLSTSGNDKLLYGRRYIISAFTDEAFEARGEGYRARANFLPTDRILTILNDVRVYSLDEKRKIYQPSSQVRFSLEGAVAFVREGVSPTDLAKARDEAQQVARDQESRESLFRTLVHQGDLAYNSGNWSGALNQYKAASTIRPDIPLVHADLGAVYQVQNKLPEAEAAYRLALELDPSDVDTSYNLGQVLEQRGHLNEALDQYQKVLKKRPHDSEAKERVSKLSLKLGR